MIGIVDGDTFSFNQQRRRYLPNLLLMKLYSYFKKIGLPVKLLQFSLQVQECDLIYIRLLHFYSPILLLQFFSNKNTHIGGSKFTGNIYIPFKNKEIEECNPDVRLYKLFIPYAVNNKLIFVSRFLNSLFVRLQQGHTDLSRCSQKRAIYIYDLHPSLMLDKVPSLMIYLPRSIAFNHSIFITNRQEFLNYKNMVHLIGANKIGKLLTRVRFYWPYLANLFYDLLNSNLLVINSFGRTSLLIPLIIDNGYNMLYNIIEGIKKYYLIKQFNKRATMHYILNESPYHLFCSAFQQYSWTCLNGWINTSFMEFCQKNKMLCCIIRKQLEDFNLPQDIIDIIL